MRKLLTLIIIVVVMLLLALWSPWRYWNFDLTQLIGVRTPDAVGGLQVSSLAGEISVYLDQATDPIVTVKPGDTGIVPGVSPGQHQIRLVRKGSFDDSYWELNRLINFVAGVDVIIAYELGPTSEFSEGHILSASKRAGGASNTAEVYLNVTTNADDVDIFIDGISVGKSPLKDYRLSTTEQHRIILTKEGYEKQEFLLLPESQEDRDKLNGMDLNVEANLFLQPLLVRENN